MSISKCLYEVVIIELKMWNIMSRMNTDEEVTCHILIPQAQDCSSGTRGITRSSTSPYSTTHNTPVFLVSSVFYLWYWIVPPTIEVWQVLKQRCARKLCWKAWGVNPSPGVLLVLRFEGMAMEDFELRAKPCQFCIVFSKELEVTPSGKGCQAVKIQVEALCSRGTF